MTRAQLIAFTSPGPMIVTGGPRNPDGRLRHAGQDTGVYHQVSALPPG